MFQVNDLSWTLANLARRLMGRKTLEQERAERMNYLKELLVVPEVDIIPPSAGKKYFNKLVDEFTVSSLIVAKSDGSVVASSDDNGFSQAVKGSSLFEYISAELPDAKYLLIKNDEKVYAIYPHNDLLYIIQTTGTINPLELRALVQQADKGVASG